MFSNTLRVVMVVAAALLLPAADGLAQVIDDFEQGAFSVQSTTFDSGVQTGLTPPHCISSARDVRLFVNGTISGGQLTLGSVDDEVATVFGNGGGRLEFRYTPMPTDLTVGGVFNAVRVNLTVAEPAGRVQVVLRDIAGHDFLSTQFITGPAAYDFLYQDFSGVDVQMVDFIQVNLDVPDFGDYHISDIRPWEVPGVSAKANVITGAIQAGVGDYPTEPLQIILSPAGEPDRHLGMMEISILSVTNAEAHGIVGLADDSGPGDAFGEQAFVQLLDPAPVGGRQKSSHFRNIRMRVELKPAEFMPQLAEVSEVDFFGADFIRCVAPKLKVYYQDREGNVVARGIHTLLVEGMLANGLEVHDPVFTMPTAADPNAFEVAFDVNMVGAVKSGGDLAMVEMQLNGSIFDYATSTPVDTWAPNQTLALWAQPSVMSHETLFQLERGLDQRSTLQVFDVAGRRVRSLSLPAGSTALRWDGRDEHGSDVASGVYLARLVSARGEAKAKLVKVQ